MRSHDRSGLQRLWGLLMLELAEILPFARLGPLRLVSDPG